MTFDWNEDKNSMLKTTRGISFEEVVLYISEGMILDILIHPNTKTYPNQYLYLINRDDYVWVVPFIKDEEKDMIFLKTAFPSRVYTKKYLKGGE